MRCNRKLLSTLLITSITGILLSSSASAKTITVKKGGANPTIASGLALAGTNDTIKVKAGVYQENPVIAVGLSGLKLIANGKVTIEARPAGGAGVGPGITVDAPNVTIRGFIIQNAASSGHGISATGNNLKVEKCLIRNCDGDGINADIGVGLKVINCDFNRISGTGINAIGPAANNVVVTGCDGYFCFDGFIDITGDSASVARNEALNINGDFIHITGNDAIVQKNKCNVVAGSAVEIIGDKSKIHKNHFRNLDSTAITITGSTTTDRSMVTKNRIEKADGTGIFINSQEATISKNKLNCIDGDGIQTGSTCDNAVISKNLVSFARNDAIRTSGENPDIDENTLYHAFNDGIDVGGTPTDGEVCHNTITNINEIAIRMGTSTSGFMLDGNYIYESATGMRLRGSGHLVINNKIAECAFDGYRIEGTGGHIVRRNKAIENAGDGFDVRDGSANNVLEKNTATGNAAEGFANHDVTGTTINDNTSKRNRIDFANDSTNSAVLTSFTGNKSSDGTHAPNPPDPEVE